MKQFRANLFFVLAVLIFLPVPMFCESKLIETKIDSNAGGMNENAFNSEHSCTCTMVAIERLSQDRIDIRKKKIEKQLFRNKCLRYGLRGASVAAIGSLAGYLIWRRYNAVIAAHFDLSQIKTFCEDGKSLIEEYAPESAQNVFDNAQLTKALCKMEKIFFPLMDNTIGMAQAIEKQQRDIDYLKTYLPKPTPTTGLWQWTKFIGKRVVDFAGFSVGWFAISKLNAKVQKIFTEHDLNWFIQENTTIEKTLSELHHASQQLNEQDISEYQRDFYLLMLPRSCNRILSQLEGIIAFMEYSNERLPYELVTAHGLSMMPRYLFNCVNDRYNDIESLLKQVQDDHSDSDAQRKIELSIAQLETEVINTIERYKDTFIIATKKDNTE